MRTSTFFPSSPAVARPRRSAALPSPARANLGCSRLPDARRSSRTPDRRCKRAPTTSTAAAAQPAAQEQATTALQAFLRWALANGVEGVGAADSKVALYEGEGGERGVVSLQPIAAGEAVLRLGTRMAITDHQGGEGDEGDEEQEVDADAQPWSVRLAGLLLVMVQQGDACPWQPYLNVLPRTVPSPLTTFSWEDVEAIEYEPMRRELDHASWLAMSACQQGGGFSREQWDWALSVVHSRTFGAPGRSSAGGVGVRMLVPLVDMLNHGGDCLTSPPGAADPSVQACDNVRWDLKAPASAEGEWEMVVSATRDIPAGEELLLSYGERNNDSFFLHYGFLPPRNPHDDVALFPDVEAGVDWWLDAFLPTGAMPPQHLQLVISAAYDAAEQQDSSATAAEAVLASVPEAEADVIRAQLSRVKLSAGGMVDGRLLAAYRTLYESAAAAGQPARQEAGGGGGVADLGSGWQQHMRIAVGLRCRELLRGMPTPLLQDLRRLADWEQQAGDQQHCWGAAQQHYAAAVEAFERQHGSMLGEGLGKAAGHAADSGTAAAAPGGSSSNGGSSEAPLLDAGAAAGSGAALAQMLLQQAAAGEQPGDGEAGGVAEPGGGASILPVQFRAYKKMILTDAVLLSAE